MVETWNIKALCVFSVFSKNKPIEAGSDETEGTVIGRGGKGLSERSRSVLAVQVCSLWTHHCA